MKAHIYQIHVSTHNAIKLTINTICYSWNCTTSRDFPDKLLCLLNLGYVCFREYQRRWKKKRICSPNFFFIIISRKGSYAKKWHDLTPDLVIKSRHSPNQVIKKMRWTYAKFEGTIGHIFVISSPEKWNESIDCLPPQRWHYLGFPAGKTAVVNLFLRDYIIKWGFLLHACVELRVQSHSTICQPSKISFLCHSLSWGNFSKKTYPTKIS